MRSRSRKQSKQQPTSEGAAHIVSYRWATGVSKEGQAARKAMEGVVHPAAVTDAILRWASDAGWESSPNARHPAATALLLRSACALARVAPNADVLQRQLRHAQALLQVVRDSAGLNSRGGPAHWGPPFAWCAATLLRP